MAGEPSCPHGNRNMRHRWKKKPLFGLKGIPSAILREKNPKERTPSVLGVLKPRKEGDELGMKAADPGTSSPFERVFGGGHHLHGHSSARIAMIHKAEIRSPYEGPSLWVPEVSSQLDFARNSVHQPVSKRWES